MNNKIFFFWMIIFVVLFNICSFSQNALVLQTDFGTQDGAVAAMKGVAFGVDRNLPVFDLTHNITPFDIWEGAYRLWQVAPYWPAGTVFVSVIDPGVGTIRKPIILKTKSNHYFVTPDNGTITLVAEKLGISEARQIDETRNRLPGSNASYTFHGRDVFVYAGARLASGKITWEEVGPVFNQTLAMLPYTKAECKDNTIFGTIVVLDPAFGNIWTNISGEIFEDISVQYGNLCDVKIFQLDKVVYQGSIPYMPSFGDVPKGQPLLYLNSLLQIAVALNQDSFAQTYKIGAGSEWRIEIRKK